MYIPEPCEMNAVDQKLHPLPTEFDDDQSTSPQNLHELRQKANSDAFAALSRLRKNLLYLVLIFTLGSHNLGISCFFTTTEAIAADLRLDQGGNAIWVVTSYAMTFAAFIPLSGRLADVVKPQWCFLSGLGGIAVLLLGSGFGTFGRMVQN